MHLQSKMFEIIERNQKIQEKIVNQFREIKVMQIRANFFWNGANGIFSSPYMLVNTFRLFLRYTYA